MACKRKGTAMYDKTKGEGKSKMKLKKEFGGAMEMKSPMDINSPMDKALKADQDKLPHGLKQAIEDSPGKMTTPMELKEQDSAMDMSHMKLTEDAAMKFKSMAKKGLLG